MTAHTMMYTSFNTSEMSPLSDGNSTEEANGLAEIMTHEMRKAALPVTIFVGIEAVIGFFGNLLVLYVFFFRYHMCNFRYFVLCLAITDLTSTLTTMPGEIVTQTYWYTYPVEEICKIKSFFNIFTVSAEAMCLLLISVDRFRKLCRPAEWQIKPKSAVRLCFVIYALATLIAIPCAILWGTQVVERRYKGVNVTVKICLVDDDYDNTGYPLAYSIVTETLVCISLVVMLVLYIFIARALLKRRRPSSRLSQLACIEPSNPSPIAASPQNRPGRKHDAETEQRTVACTSNADDIPKEPAHEKSKASNAAGASGSDVCDDKVLKDQTQVPQRKPTILTKVEETVKCYTPERCAENGSVTKVTKHEHVQSTESHRVTRNAEFESAMQKKTLIMFILTVVFVITTILYLTLLSLIATDILQSMTNACRSAYFFFFRLYFINHVINPVVYGLLDSKFRRVMAELRKSMFAVVCKKFREDKGVHV